MNTVKSCSIFGLALAVPLASAAADDASYCAALGASYRKYVGFVQADANAGFGELYEAKRQPAPIIEASASYQRLSKYNDFDKYYVTFTPDSVAVGVSIAIPVFTGGDSFSLASGVRGFSWSPIGLYELAGLTRS